MASREYVVRSAKGVEVVRRERWAEGRFIMSYVLRTPTRETVYDDCADADEAWLMAIGEAPEAYDPATVSPAAPH